MIEELAERFCASRRRWLIVTGVTFVIALASVLPQVDLLLAERSERADLLAQLSQTIATVDEIPLFEQRVSEKRQEVQGLRDLGVDEERLAGLRTWIVDAARQSGCQVRRIDFSSPSSRRWSKGDEPLSSENKPDSRSGSPFRLENRTVSLSVTGSSGEVVALLKAIDSDPRLKHANGIELKQTNRRQDELQLDLTLWYFALVRQGDVA